MCIFTIINIFMSITSNVLIRGLLILTEFDCINIEIKKKVGIVKVKCVDLPSFSIKIMLSNIPFHTSQKTSRERAKKKYCYIILVAILINLALALRQEREREAQKLRDLKRLLEIELWVPIKNQFTRVTK